MDLNFIANAAGGAPTNGLSVSGAMPTGDVQALYKALEMGYGTDQAQLSGGGALRIQSLDKTMKATIAQNKHFRLFNALPKPSATATVDEWTEQSGVGGYLGGTTNTETGVIANAQGDYARRVGMVKYLMTRREVSFVSTVTNNIVSAEQTEQNNGAVQLLQDAEFLCFEGDSAVVPTEFDGIDAQIKGLGISDNYLDAAAQPLASIDLVNKAAATVVGFGNFGTPTHLFQSPLVQADFDTGLDPAFRVPLTDVGGGGISLGAPVRGIRTSWGDIATVPDVFIRDEARQTAFELQYAAVAAANVAFKPAGVAVAVAAGGASSKFGAGHAGNYYYAVAGINAKGQSAGTVSLVAAVAAGDGVTLTITPSAGGTETGYVIYRSRRNGTNAIADMRQMIRIPKAQAGNTVFVDRNEDIPGTSKAYILNLLQGDDAIAWRQLLPMTKFPLYPTNSPVLPWAQMLFGYLRIAKRRHHVVIKNILPNGAVWRPF